MTIPYVYLISWKQLDTHYCGSSYCENAHPSNLWTKYFTSSKHVKEFRKLHGEPDHIEILKEFPNDPFSARVYEIKTLREFDVLHKENWLNKHIPGLGFKGRNLGFKQTEEWKKQMSLLRKGRILSEEWKRKISEAAKKQIRKPHSEEAKKKIGLASKLRKRKPLSIESREKISKSLSGRKNGPPSEETKRKISEKQKGIKRGPMSEEHKRKISEGHRLNKTINRE